MRSGRQGICFVFPVLIGLSGLLMAGCDDVGTFRQLPDSTRVPMPDLRGVWILDPGNDDEKAVIVVTAQPPDERGCVIARLALFDGNGDPGRNWESRDPYEPDWELCAHQISGLLVVEHRKVPETASVSVYKHFLLEPEDPALKLCYVDALLWDYAPETGRVKSGGGGKWSREERYVTLPGDAVAELISTHATELSAYFDNQCRAGRLIRAIPRRPDDSD